MKYILKIQDKEAGSIRISGGKGASLSRLTQRFPEKVPDGFIITTEFFKYYIQPAVIHVQDDIKSAVAGLTLPADASRNKSRHQLLCLPV